MRSSFHLPAKEDYFKNCPGNFHLMKKHFPITFLPRYVASSSVRSRFLVAVNPPVDRRNSKSNAQSPIAIRSMPFISEFLSLFFFSVATFNRTKQFETVSFDVYQSRDLVECIPITFLRTLETGHPQCNKKTNETNKS